MKYNLLNIIIKLYKLINQVLKKGSKNIKFENNFYSYMKRFSFKNLFKNEFFQKLIYISLIFKKISNK